MLTLPVVIAMSFIVFCTGYQDQELTLIDELNVRFSFDHNIFLLPTSTNVKCFSETTGGSVTPQSVYVIDASNNITELESLNRIMSKNTLVIVVAVTAKLSGNLNLLLRLKQLQYVNVNMKIGMFYPNVFTVTNEDLNDLFRWSWKQRIIHFFAVIHPSQSEQSINIFTFNPFGTFRVINATDEWYENVFLHRNANFRHYPIVLMGPKADVAEMFWHDVFGVMNASYVRSMKWLLDDEVDKINGNGLVVTSFGFSLEEGEIAGFTYPFATIHLVVIAPEALPYDGFGAYLRAFTTGKILFFLIITIAAIIIFLCYFRFKRQNQFSVFESTVDVLNLLMNDNGNIAYRQLSNIEVMLLVPLTFAGLIIVNGLLSALQSYFTRPIFRPQIDSAEDIHNSPFCVYVAPDGFDDFMYENVLKSIDV